MDANCNSCLEGILENHTDIRGGCHFCLIKSDILTYNDILDTVNPKHNVRKKIIGNYIINKHGIGFETFSAVYSFIVKE